MRTLVILMFCCFGLQFCLAAPRFMKREATTDEVTEKTEIAELAELDKAFKEFEDAMKKVGEEFEGLLKELGNLGSQFDSDANRFSFNFDTDFKDFETQMKNIGSEFEKAFGSPDVVEKDNTENFEVEILTTTKLPDESENLV